MANPTGLTLPLGLSINKRARAKVLDYIHQTGKFLPATVSNAKGSVVTANFQMAQGEYSLPQVTIPMFGPEYVRNPMQEGDKGVVIATNYDITGMSGLGGASSQGAAYSNPGNLAALLFMPIGNKNFSPVDGNKWAGYGKNGALMRDIDSNAVFSADGSQNVAGGGVGKPSSGFDPANIDPRQYNHYHSADATNGALTASQVAARIVGAITHVGSETASSGSGQPNYPATTIVNTNATENHNINSPNTNASGNMNVAQTLTALTAAVGSITNQSGGALNSGGGASSGIGAGALQDGAASTNIGALGGDLMGTLPDPFIDVAKYTFTTLPAAPSQGSMAVVTDATSGLGWGSAVTSGLASTPYLVWFNGASWTVMGK
jgi:hypothetical protein